MSPSIRLLAGCCAILLASIPARAHEFVVLPDKMTAKAGEALGVRVLSTHVFFADEELEDPNDSTACIFAGGKRTPIAIKPNASKLSFEGTASVPVNSSFVVCGNRKAQIWAQTPAGTKRGGRAEHPGSPLVRTIEKFSKAIVNASPADDTWSKPIGDRLEILPKANPATLKVGDELPIQVMFDGKPLVTRVLATYGGFSKREMTFAAYAEMDKTATAYIPITKPGTWLVRVEHIQQEKTAAHDRYDARSVLLLEVKP